MQNEDRFFRRCIIAAALIPLIAFSAAAVKAKAAPAKFGCDCDAAKCTKALTSCYSLICSDPEKNKTCYGKWKVE